MVITAKAGLLSFEEFLKFDDGNELHEYELVAGRLVLMPEPSELHEEILEFLSFVIGLEYRRLKLKYSVRKRNGLEVSPATGRRPDVAVIDRPLQWRDDAAQLGIRSVPHMIIEIASSNWSNDLVDKQEEYEALGVPEYWIVDYRGQIPAKYCLRGKGIKTIVLTLVDGEYQRREYIGDEVIPCLTFPELKLTTQEIVRAGIDER